jgi:carbonic anhydrase
MEVDHSVQSASVQIHGLIYDHANDRAYKIASSKKET